MEKRQWEVRVDGLKQELAQALDKMTGVVKSVKMFKHNTRKQHDDHGQEKRVLESVVAQLREEVKQIQQRTTQQTLSDRNYLTDVSSSMLSVIG